MASGGLTRAAQAIAERTVHISIHPTPRSFHERREVLRVLERFGEVVFFRSYKYQPGTTIQNTCLTIFSTKEPAQEIIDSSPLRYRMISSARAPQEDSGSPSTDESTAATKEAPASDASTTNTDIPESTEPALNSSSENSKPTATAVQQVFELNLSTSSFDHRKHIREQPLYGPYKPISPKYSYVAASLDRVVADSLWSAGLKDWETDGQRFTRETEAPAEGLDRGSGSLSSVYRAGRRFREEQERDMPRVMKGLGALVRERQERAGREAERRTENVSGGELKVE